MIGYVSVGTNDLGASGKFYDALLSLMGGEREAELPYYILWRFPGGGPRLMLTIPYDKRNCSPGNGNMLALRVSSKDDVDAVHRLAIGLGGVNEGSPGERPTRKGFYAGYFRDLDGNKLNVFYLPPSAS